MKTFAVYLLLPLALMAQQGPPRGSTRQRPSQSQQSQPATTKPEDFSTLEGQVLNATTGEPLGKAALTLRRADAQAGPAGGGPRSYSATSDSSGRFSIVNIEPGKYRLSATRTGFVNGEYGARDSMQAGSTLTLDPKQQMRELLFRMTPNGVITGKVVDEDREPVAFLQVQAMRNRYSQGKKQMVSYGSATTNDLGEYRIFGLPPGRYYISVSARRNYAPDRRGAVQQGTEEEYVTTFFPGTTEAAAAAPLDIGPGSLFTGANVALGKRRTVHVKGRVSDASSTATERRRPMVFLIPRALGSSSSMNRPSSIDANGNFDIGSVTAGSYTLVASIQDRGRSLMTRMPVEVGNGNVENLSITINPALNLSGGVRLDGQAVADVSTVQVSLRPRDPIGMIPGSSNANSKVTTDGSFSFQNLNADVYNVTLSGLPDGFYVKSVSFGGQDALLSGLNLSSGAASPLDIVLAPNAGQATGVVQNDQQQPAPGVTVVLIPQERERKEQMQYYKTATTDAAGSFAFKNLDPGHYKAYAWKEVESGAYMDPEFVGPVENRGETVSIHEGSQENLQVKLN